MQDIDIRNFEDIKRVIGRALGERHWKGTELANAIQQRFGLPHSPKNKVYDLLNPGKSFSLETLWQAAQVLEVSELIFSTYYSTQDDDGQSEQALKRWIIGLELELNEARDALVNRRFAIPERIIIKKRRT